MPNPNIPVHDDQPTEEAVYTHDEEELSFLDTDIDLDTNQIHVNPYGTCENTPYIRA